MDDREIDLRKLDHVKDAAVAEFQARSGMWHTLMAGGIAAAGLAGLAVVQGVLNPWGGVAMLGAAALTLGGGEPGPCQGHPRVRGAHPHHPQRTRNP